MSEQIATDDKNLATRAFDLLHKLSRGGKLTSSETHELLQIRKIMASSDVFPRLQSGLETLSNKIDAQNSKIDAQNSKVDAQNSKIDVQNSKYNVLIVVISIVGAALSIALSIN